MLDLRASDGGRVHVTIHEIGFGLYSGLLQRAVADLKSGREPLLDRFLDHGTCITADLPEGEQRIEALHALFDRLAGRANLEPATLSFSQERAAANLALGLRRLRELYDIRIEGTDSELAHGALSSEDS